MLPGKQVLGGWLHGHRSWPSSGQQDQIPSFCALAQAAARTPQQNGVDRSCRASAADHRVFSQRHCRKAGIPHALSWHGAWKELAPSHPCNPAKSTRKPLKRSSWHGLSCFLLSQHPQQVQRCPGSRQCGHAQALHGVSPQLDATSLGPRSGTKPLLVSFGQKPTEAKMPSTGLPNRAKQRRLEKAEVQVCAQATGTQVTRGQT